MLKLRKVAVTGVVASGKSAVLCFFREFGAFTVDCDQLVKELFSKDKDLIKKISSLLGKEVIAGGVLDSTKVAKVVFNDPSKLKSLERVLHPIVLQKISTLYDQIAHRSGYSLFVAEVPLLFEIQADDRFDYTVAVISDLEQCKARFNKSDFEKRLKRQLSQEEKAKRADYVISNLNSLENLKQETFKLYELLTKKPMLQ